MLKVAGGVVLACTTLLVWLKLETNWVHEFETGQRDTGQATATAGSRTNSNSGRFPHISPICVGWGTPQEPHENANGHHNRIVRCNTKHGEKEIFWIRFNFGLANCRKGLILQPGIHHGPYPVEIQHNFNPGCQACDTGCHVCDPNANWVLDITTQKNLVRW
jgi:hypothetical protein